MPITPSDLATEGGACWLLEVDWERVPYRFTDRISDGSTLALTDADGVDLEYSGGLDIAWRSDFALMSESAAPPVVSVSLPFTERDDIPQKVADGADLSTMEATLYRWAPGMTHAARVPVFTRRAQQPNYGASGEPVAVTFESPIYRDGLIFPSGRIEAGQISVDSDLATGDPYPLVFGNPAATAANSSLQAGAPAPVLEDTNRYLLAGYLIGGASPSTLWDVSGDVSRSFTSAVVSDLKGRTVTRLQAEATGWDAASEWAIEYNATLGGMGAGDLLVYCAEASSLRVDTNEFRTRAEPLNAYKFSGYIDAEGVSPWEWATRNILSLLPASAYYGPAGLSLRVWDDTATTADAMATLDTATDPIVRVGPVQYESGNIVNELTIRYLPDQSGAPTQARTITGRPTLASGSSEAYLSPHAAASVSRLRGRDAAGELAGVRSKSIESPFIYEEATALRVAGWMIRAHAKPRRVVTYRDTNGALEWLEETEHVTITDSEIALSGALAMVRSRRWSGGVFYVDLVLIDDILR